MALNDFQQPPAKHERNAVPAASVDFPLTPALTSVGICILLQKKAGRRRLCQFRSLPPRSSQPGFRRSCACPGGGGFEVNNRAKHYFIDQLQKERTANMEKLAKAQSDDWRAGNQGSAVF